MQDRLFSVVYKKCPDIRILNVFLARRINSLTTELKFIRDKKVLVENATVPPMQILNLQGQSSQLSYAESALPSVVYIFGVDCHFCGLNMDNLKTLIAGIDKDYKFTAISLDKDLAKLKNYIEEQKFPGAVYFNPSERDWLEYGLGATPQTLVISPEGKVIKKWTGFYAKEVKTEIETFFKVKLTEPKDK